MLRPIIERANATSEFRKIRKTISELEEQDCQTLEDQELIRELKKELWALRCQYVFKIVDNECSSFAT